MGGATIWCDFREGNTRHDVNVYRTESSGGWASSHAGGARHRLHQKRGGMVRPPGVACRCEYARTSVLSITRSGLGSSWECLKSRDFPGVFLCVKQFLARITRARIGASEVDGPAGNERWNCNGKGRRPRVNIRSTDERHQSWKQFLDTAYWAVELKRWYEGWVGRHERDGLRGCGGFPHAS